MSELVGSVPSESDSLVFRSVDVALVGEGHSSVSELSELADVESCVVTGVLREFVLLGDSGVPSHMRSRRRPALRCLIHSLSRLFTSSSSIVIRFVARFLP